MASTFQAVGFEKLYIKGVLWDLATFKGESGDDQTSTVVGPAGDPGQDGIFEFNTVNTTSTTVSISLPDPSVVSYNALYIKSNGSFNSEISDGGAVPINNHQSNLVTNMYNNGRPQSIRFSKNDNRWII